MPAAPSSCAQGLVVGYRLIGRRRMASNVAKRTVLVTGASRGLGAECCRQYAQSGWAVIAASRGGRLPPGCEEHAASIEAATLDITSPDDVSVIESRAVISTKWPPGQPTTLPHEWFLTATKSPKFDSKKRTNLPKGLDLLSAPRPKNKVPTASPMNPVAMPSGQKMCSCTSSTHGASHAIVRRVHACSGECVHGVSPGRAPARARSAAPCRG